MTNPSTLNRFADLAAHYAELTAAPDRYPSDDTPLVIEIGRALPDADAAAAAVELIVRTLFEVTADTALEPHADRIAWGLVHSFHKVAEGLEAQADAAAQDVRRLADEQDGSEVAATELEAAQTRAHELDEAGDAVASWRDIAAEAYRAETGRPWSSPRGSCVSAKRTASVIAAADFLRARAERRRERLAPEGPIVVFSGGQAWHDHALIYAHLDAILARIPHMVLVTTAQNRGADAIAAAWAAAHGVKLVAFTLNASLGKRAAFKRNERLLALRPVEAIVTQGSGVQSNLYARLREAGVPCRALRADAQAVTH